MKNVGNVSKRMIDRGLVANQTYAHATQQIDFIGQQSFDPEFDWPDVIIRHIKSHCSQAGVRPRGTSPTVREGSDLSPC